MQLNDIRVNVCTFSRVALDSKHTAEVVLGPRSAQEAAVTV